MVSDNTYDIALPVLQDEALDDEDKTDRLEELLRKETGLTGKPLENIVLDCLWRFRDATSSPISPPPSRHTVIRRASPAPWQVNRAPTPVSQSPRAVHPPPGFGVAPPGFARAISSNASPFTSPRPSPRLAFSSPHIPHSPSLSAYQFSEGPSQNPDLYGDLGSDSVDWLVNDDSGSTESSSLFGDGTLNAGAAEWIQPQTVDMGPYDMLRSILRDDRPDEEIEKALEASGYDLSAALLTLMGSQVLNGQQMTIPMPEPATFHIGKSMSPAFRPATPAGQAKSNIICKYYLSSGKCARADCRFSHDTTTTLCKYYMSGNCLAGNSCAFSHDPSGLMARMVIADASTPPLQSAMPNFQMQDYEFPVLHNTSSPGWTPQLGAAEPVSLEQYYGLTSGPKHPPPGLSPFPNFSPGNMSRPHSRPSSRQHSRAATPSVPAVDDNEAFPSLGSAAAKGAKRHHGKRGGHGHNNRDNVGPNNIADVVRMSPSPAPAQLRKSLRPTKSFNGSRENSAAAQAIPPPQHIPWLDTGEKANKAYLQARTEAFKHGSLRNKFLQSAAQAWNRSDSRAAKALSLRGQSENNLMREAHREAARILYEERNQDDGPDARELYVDLHGLHPDEAVSYLEGILLKHNASTRPVYAITGTGHHSKNGKDKVGKAVRGFLNDWRYAFREFSVPGDRNNVGGILGIEPSSYDKSAAERAKESEDSPPTESDSLKRDSKVRIMRRDESLDGVPKGPKRDDV